MSDSEYEILIAVVDFANKILTWVLVVVGWIVVSDQQYHRELIKVRREKVEDLRKRLRELEISSRKFHTTEFDHSLSREILKSAGSISMEISLLKNEGVVGLGTLDDMIALRQSITSNNFEETVHVPSCGEDLLIRLDSAFSGLDRQLAVVATNLQKRRQTVFESLKDIRKRLY